MFELANKNLIFFIFFFRLLLLKFKTFFDPTLKRIRQLRRPAIFSLSFVPLCIPILFFPFVFLHCSLSFMHF
uniref:Uncharacterized protein n=1 Tax=Panagrolaimus sp. ES5 TaxID=591445 RepID=A0AC34GPJ7_9BILA